MRVGLLALAIGMALGGCRKVVDQDGDGAELGADCDDSSADIGPGVVEVPYDGLDNDCDPLTLDDDLDGDGVLSSADCDDSDDTIAPGADEPCDGIDNDCDRVVDDVESGGVEVYADVDGDGFGDPAARALVCGTSDGWVTDNTDCDDGDDKVNTDANEACDGADNDCDGLVDNGVGDTWYADGDGDGHGDATMTEVSCDGTGGYVDDSTDCDDAEADVYTGAPEVCDGADNNCDGLEDNDAVDEVTWYVDVDGDGFGPDASAAAACDAPAPDMVMVGGDCDDAKSDANPEAYETCEGSDQDCDGTIDNHPTDGTDYYTDSDGDGYGAPATRVRACAAPAGPVVTVGGDCNDAAAAISPAAIETCDTVDQDCDGSVDDGASDARDWYADTDGDSHGDAAAHQRACAAPQGFVASSDDCNDAAQNTYPTAPDGCDGVDTNCDGVLETPTNWYTDADVDGYGSATVVVSCGAAPAGTVANSLDCNDAVATINPVAVELCDAFDQNCDGALNNNAVNPTVWYQDLDNDTYGNPAVSQTACAAPTGYVANSTDCSDAAGAVHPLATELCNGVDDNCNSLVDDGVSTTRYYLDADGDTQGNVNKFVTVCGVAPAGYVANGNDCLDTDAGWYKDGAGACAVGVNCQEIKAEGRSAGDGTYLIDPDGPVGAFAAFTATCDMTTDGGGWTLFYATKGADGDQPMVSNTAVAGNPLTFGPYNLTVAQKVALSAAARESIAYKGPNAWLKWNRAPFDATLAVGNSHAHYTVSITGADGTTAHGFAGWSTRGYASGGDFNLSQTDGATCSGTMINGVDHHVASYDHLNCSCQRQYLYSYSAGVGDSDAGYDVNTALGSWPVTAGCDAAEGGSLTFRAGMR